MLYPENCLERLGFNEVKQQEAVKEAQAKATNWKAILIGVGISIALILLLFLLLPRLIFAYMKLRHSSAKSIGNRAFWAYRTTGFYLHQLGYFKSNNTALQHAQMVDATLATNYTQFMLPYLKLKYAKQELNATDAKTVSQFLPVFISRVKTAIPFKQRFVTFFKVFRAISFFGIGED